MHSLLFHQRRSVFFFALCALTTLAAMVRGDATTYGLYVTGYAGAVVPLTFTPPSTLRKSGPSLTSTGSAPSWITFGSRDGVKRAYVTNESPGSVFVVQSSSSGAPVDVIGNKQGYSTGGDAPVASCIQGSCLFAANYNSGSASVLQLEKDGLPASKSPIRTFHYTRQGIGPVTSRQDHCYAHDVVASPDGKWVYVSDLGADQIHHIRAAENGDCQQVSNTGTSTTVATGSGPRHLAFYRDPVTKKQFAYLASELACTLTAFQHDPATGALSMIGQPVLSAPAGTPLGGNQTAGPQRTTAEVAVSNDGRFVYVSDRGDEQEDHLSIFERDPLSGQITFRKWVPSGGLMPRHFSLSSDSLFLAVGHQTTGNVVIFARDLNSGDLHKTGAELNGLGAIAFTGFVPT